MTESADCSSELIELIGTLFDNSDQSDMCLLIDGQEVHLHKLVIFKQSEVFRDLFEKATDASDLYHHINNTNEHPECMQVFRNFLEFFYTGKIDLSTDTIVPIVFLAYKYKVLSLSVCCHTYIKRYLSNESPPPDIDVVAAWYVHTLLQASDFAWLRDLCFEMMKRTLYQLIASSTSWYKLSFDDVFQLVRNSDVLVKDEFSLYDAMETWLEHCYNDDSEQLSTSLQECIQYVRFPMMSPTQLAKVQDSNLCREHLDLYSQLLLEAYQFHTCGTQVEPDEYSRFVLRDYLIQPDKLPRPPSQKPTTPPPREPSENGDRDTMNNGNNRHAANTTDDEMSESGSEDGKYPSSHSTSASQDDLENEYITSDVGNGNNDDAMNTRSGGYHCDNSVDTTTAPVTENSANNLSDTGHGETSGAN